MKLTSSSDRKHSICITMPETNQTTHQTIAYKQKHFFPTNSNNYTVFPTRKRLQPMLASIEPQFSLLTPLFSNSGFPQKLQVLKLLQAASNPGIRNCSLRKKKNPSCHTHTPLNLLNFNLLRINLEIHLGKKANVYRQFSNKNDVA